MYLITKAIINHHPEIEHLRRQLLKDKTVIEIEEMGAGSRTSSATQRTVSHVAAAALKSKRLAQVLFRMAKHYQPSTIVELGTSFGITTSYLSKANPTAWISAGATITRTSKTVSPVGVAKACSIW